MLKQKEYGDKCDYERKLKRREDETPENETPEAKMIREARYAKEDEEEMKKKPKIDEEYDRRAKLVNAQNYLQIFGQPPDRYYDTYNEKDLYEYYIRRESELLSLPENQEYIKANNIEQLPKNLESNELIKENAEIRNIIKRKIIGGRVDLDSMMEDKIFYMNNEKSFWREIDIITSESAEEEKERLEKYAKEDELENKKLSAIRNRYWMKFQKFIFEKYKEHFNEFSDLQNEINDLFTDNEIEIQLSHERLIELAEQQEIRDRKLVEKKMLLDDQKDNTFRSRIKKIAQNAKPKHFGETYDEIEQDLFEKFGKVIQKDNLIQMQIFGGIHEDIVRLKEIQQEENELRKKKRELFKKFDIQIEDAEDKKIREEEEDDEWKSRAIEEQITLGDSIWEHHESKINFSDDEE